MPKCSPNWVNCKVKLICLINYRLASFTKLSITILLLLGFVCQEANDSVSEFGPLFWKHARTLFNLISSSFSETYFSRSTELSFFCSGSPLKTFSFPWNLQNKSIILFRAVVTWLTEILESADSFDMPRSSNSIIFSSISFVFSSRRQSTAFDVGQTIRFYKTWIFSHISKLKCWLAKFDKNAFSIEISRYFNSICSEIPDLNSSTKVWLDGDKVSSASCIVEALILSFRIDCWWINYARSN